MLCAVMGFPIKHSLSPVIYEAFAKHTEVSLHCEKIEATSENFSQHIQTFIARGGVGAGVTIPLKEVAYRWVACASDEAHQAGAVSMIHINHDGVVWGYNFDGLGLLNDLKRIGAHIADRRVLLLGAGGAAKGVLTVLLAQKPRQLVIANRTLEKASQLAVIHANVVASHYDALDAPFDVVINATSASLHGEMLPLPARCVSAESVCYDMMYTKTPTSFLQWAKTVGVERVADGLGMLVSHCACAFPVWTGKVLSEALIMHVLEDVRAAYYVDK